MEPLRLQADSADLHMQRNDSYLRFFKAWVLTENAKQLQSQSDKPHTVVTLLGVGENWDTAQIDIMHWDKFLEVYWGLLENQWRIAYCRMFLRAILRAMIVPGLQPEPEDEPEQKTENKRNCNW